MVTPQVSGGIPRTLISHLPTTMPESEARALASRLTVTEDDDWAYVVVALGRGYVVQVWDGKEALGYL